MQETTMPVPDFKSFFKPLLDLAADGKEHSLREAREQLGNRLGTTYTANYQIRRVDSDYVVEE